MKNFIILGLLFSIHSISYAENIKQSEQAKKESLQAIQKYKLTSIKNVSECLILDTIEKKKYFEVAVYERHNEFCGGSPETQPRLFSIRVKKSNGAMTSDAYDYTTFQPLNHKR